ncbi:hypothetical protein IEQ34_017011 [Dendrobium chrysotoxum]|uniref:Uncharacterized protein n=1 Tax=Dendrobium chrysotoxum TaxID=161865 RepID=A0AAV7GHZ4_DENCH|nr:hypothetical protein IEQ34_017011 [Dendrobium chrysotoxum]
MKKVNHSYVGGAYLASQFTYIALDGMVTLVSMTLIYHQLYELYHNHHLHHNLVGIDIPLPNSSNQQPLLAIVQHRRLKPQKIMLLLQASIQPFVSKAVKDNLLISSFIDNGGNQITTPHRQHQLYGENFFESFNSYSMFYHQNCQNGLSLSSKDSCLRHFRPTQDLGVDNVGHGLHNLVELVETVLQSSIGMIKNCNLEELRELGSRIFGMVKYGLSFKGKSFIFYIILLPHLCVFYILRVLTSSNEVFILANFGHGRSFAIVTKYMIDGSLQSVFINYNEYVLYFSNTRSATNLFCFILIFLSLKCLLIATDMTFQMEYLHDKNIINFNLKYDNLLVNLKNPRRPICKRVRNSSLDGPKKVLIEQESCADLHYGEIIGIILSSINFFDRSDSVQHPKAFSGRVKCDPTWRSLMEQCFSTEP